MQNTVIMERPVYFVFENDDKHTPIQIIMKIRPQPTIVNLATLIHKIFKISVTLSFTFTVAVDGMMSVQSFSEDSLQPIPVDNLENLIIVKKVQPDIHPHPLNFSSMLSVLLWHISVYLAKQIHANILHKQFTFIFSCSKVIFSTLNLIFTFTRNKNTCSKYYIHLFSHFRSFHFISFLPFSKKYFILFYVFNFHFYFLQKYWSGWSQKKLTKQL